MNIPNLLTLFRILLVPLFVIFLIYGHTFYAFLTFVLAGITDALDGMIARIFNQKTLLGAYLDPIADKLLLSASHFPGNSQEAAFPINSYIFVGISFPLTFTEPSSLHCNSPLTFS